MMSVVCALVSCVVIFVVVAAGLCAIARWDVPLLLERCHVALISVGIFAEGIWISRILEGHSILAHFLMGIFAGSLLLACITDSFLYQVHFFAWWIGAVAGIWLWVAVWNGSMKSSSVWSSLGELLVFGVLQYGVFDRTYGRADCHAFFTCALVETALGAGMEMYLMQMILAYLLLIPVQLGRRNITKRGRLQCPVPFLPYINISFWLTLECIDFGCFFGGKML